MLRRKILGAALIYAFLVDVYKRQKQDSAQDAETFLKGCVGANYKVTDVRVKPGKRTPAPPFTTSTLQQEASRKLGYGVARTMQIAQKLYENGHITYMRKMCIRDRNRTVPRMRKHF